MSAFTCFAKDRFELPRFRGRQTSEDKVPVGPITDRNGWLHLVIDSWETRVLVRFGETEPGVITVRHFAASGDDGDITVVHRNALTGGGYCFDAQSGSRQRYPMNSSEVLRGDTIIRLPYEVYGKVTLRPSVSDVVVPRSSRPRAKGEIDGLAMWIVGSDGPAHPSPGITLENGHAYGGSLWATGVGISGKFVVGAHATLDLFDAVLSGHTELGSEYGGHIMACFAGRRPGSELVLSGDRERLAVTGDVGAWMYREYVSTICEAEVWGWPEGAPPAVPFHGEYVPDYFYSNGWQGGQSLTPLMP